MLYVLLMRFEEIGKNGSLQGFVLVKNCDKKSAKNGSSYLDLIIYDGESDIVAKIWDFKGTPEEQPAIGTLIRVRGTLSLYNNQPQFKIDMYRPVNDSDNVNLKDFVPSAPFEGEDMLNELIGIVNSFEDEELKTLTSAVLERFKDAILELPAAFKLHHAVRCGLLMHTLTLCRLAEAVCLIYPSVDRELLLTGAILHDIAKSEEFSLAPTGLVDGYTARGTLVGHLVAGAMIVGNIGKEKEISEDTLTLVDTFDANIFEIENALKDIEVGSFTNRMWALEDRKFYNHGRRKIVTDVNLIEKKNEEE